MSAAISFTPPQGRAVHTVDRSLIVSAAAGSGKTAVLAERCAYLVCDAPPPHRCDADSLLVLTFTDAAAAEMRGRIIESIRRRVEASPGDTRLRRQLALVDAAQISTLHSFCLWMIRRWFTEIQIDPSAAITDEHEAKLLKTEVLDELFRKLYAPSINPDDPLGTAELKPKRSADDPLTTSASSSPPLTKGGPGGVSFDASTWCLGTRTLDELSPHFVRLVEHHGLGEDASIASFIRRVHDFTASLPDPHLWLTECVTRLTPTSEAVLRETADALALELERQAEYCDQSAARIESGPTVGHFYAAKIRDYEDHLRRWRTSLSDRRDAASFESVREAIADYQFDPKRAETLKDPALREIRQPISDFFSDRIKKNLCKQRLQERFARYSVEESREGNEHTVAFVAALVDLIHHFGLEYARAKRRLNLLDFADLERFAQQLLRGGGETREPSAIARSLRSRFAHVLVDEFQDINPLQQEILRLVSREGEPGHPGNLFVVGDVKQSIYRFRLAEPALFTERVDRLRDGQAIFLQENFRSRPEILEAVNGVFRKLMREDMGSTTYDALAELRPGKPDDAPQDARPVELHLLEKPGRSDDKDDTQENSHGDGSTAREWSTIEREAYVIAQSIQEIRRQARPDKPVSYRDIAVLLRTARRNAERVAYVLARRGIPAFADVGGSLFEAMEVRDVLSALEVMDNLQQDVPLAGVMRSGVFGPPVSEDELVDIRCTDRGVPFHQAVRARAGQDDDLGGRLRQMFDTIRRYRDDARRQPLSEVIWRIYDEQAYLAYVCGLPNGPQRRANLLKLHALARQFGGFRRQGLHRFLRFIRAMADEEQEVSSAATLGESEDVVRIMSVHQSKGLEFPIVFLAGLGTKFNLRDRGGRMLSERKAHIGLRYVHLEDGTEYSTAAHSLVVDEIERTTREEDMRVLYVAMTRAKERLILLGSTDRLELFSPPYQGGAGGGLAEVRSSKIEVRKNPSERRNGPLPSWSRSAPLGKGGGEITQRAGVPLAAGLQVPSPIGSSTLGSAQPTAFELVSAKSPLDWLQSVMNASPPPIDLHTHALETMSDWSLDRADDAKDVALRAAVARGEPLPSHEPISTDDKEVESVLLRRSAVYSHASATAVPATLAAGDFRRAAAHPVMELDPSPQSPSVASSLRRSVASSSNFELRTFLPPPSKYAPSTDPAIERGLATHRVLQYLDFSAASERGGVALELQRLAECGVMSREEIARVDAAGLEWLVQTDLAARIRTGGPRFRRELRFLTTEPASAIDPAVGDASDDRVLVRGMVDAILEGIDSLEVIDYKTDAIDESQVAERTERYRSTLEVYAAAVERLWRKPVRICSLVFFAPKCIVEIAR